MKFSAIHKVVSYLMCASAFLALALSRELTPLQISLVSGFGAVSYFVEPARWSNASQARWTLGWNILTLLFFSLSVLTAIRGELLTAGIGLICFLMVNKLLNRRASRDYLHAYVLSFLMLVAGAALSTELTYALCFLLYVVFATWTLTLFHLRREMEDNFLLKHSDDAQSERVEVERILASRRIVRGSFLAGTALVSLGVFLVSVLTFFLIPRFGFGFFSAHGRKQQPTVGFSDRVELGEYGQVKDNPMIALRVELPAGPTIEPLHFRGVAFDHYQGGHWTRTSQVAVTPIQRRGRVAFVDPPSTHLDGPTRERILAGAIQQNIYLDPLDTSVLFGATKPVAFELPPPGLGGGVEIEGRRAGEVYAVEARVDLRGRIAYTERKSAMRYTVYSQVGIKDLGRILADPGYTEDAPGQALAPYLQLPVLPARVIDLAKKLAEGTHTRFQIARAVEKYLQTKLRYTLDLHRDDRYEPIEDFLFVQKAGHCEYFASSMALMLRSLGIPTRMVSGFLNGEWNEYGKYLAVRQSDAHAWVEVWLGQAGWVTFDPTPFATQGAITSSIAQRLRQVFDTMELAWFKYVIEYDLGKQVELAQGARAAVSSGMSTDKLRSTLRRGAPWAGGAAFLFALYWMVRGGPRGFSGKSRAIDPILARAMDALASRGLQRGIGETARELARRADLAGDAGASAFSELVDRCYAHRYGDEPVVKKDIDRLLHLVVRLPVNKNVRAAS